MPASALGRESEAAVQKALDQAMSDALSPCAHRLSTVVNADKIVVMKEGLVVDEGTHEELARRPDGVLRSPPQHSRRLFGIGRRSRCDLERDEVTAEAALKSPP